MVYILYFLNVYFLNVYFLNDWFNFPLKQFYLDIIYILPCLYLWSIQFNV